jgi:hypothetical protein
VVWEEVDVESLGRDVESQEEGAGCWIETLLQQLLEEAQDRTPLKCLLRYCCTRR